MNPLSRTLTFLATAAVSALFAAAAWYSTLPADVSGFSDVGKELFPEFDNVEKATELDVQDFDSQSKRLAEFSVKQDENDLWVIPSHHSYPAEAKDRLAKTATSLMGVRKKAVQSRSKDDWKRYGVVDPAASGSADAKERGTRLTLKDNSGNALVDLIVGNAVENRDGHFYVREPESNTTFIAELEVDLSAKFSDWIEPDLLKTTATNLVTITLDNYSINEQRGTVEKTELLEFAKTDLSPSGTWEMVGMDPETEQLDTSPIAAIATNLADLKIVGVRPKPEGLGGNMQINPAVKQILEMQMQQQGYFIGGDRDGKERLYSNDGELLAGDSNGVQYTLYFGEIARGTQRDIEVGLDAADSSDGDEDKETKDESSADEDSGPRRYLLVKVEFNEGLLGKKPIEPVKPQLPEILQQPAADAEPAKEGESTEEAADGDKATATEDASEASAEGPADDCGPVQEEPSQQPPADDPQPEPETKPEPKPESEPEQPQADETTTEPPKEAGTTQPGATESPAKTEPQTEQPTGEEPNGQPTQPAGTDEQPEQAKPVTPPEDPKVVAQRQYDAALAAYQTAKTAYDRDIKAWDNKVESGKKKADELFARFDRWYYVISSDSFEKFRITRNDVISEKTDEPAGGTPPGGLPGGLPGGGGFPGGIPGGLPPGLIPGGGQ